MLPSTVALSHRVNRAHLIFLALIVVPSVNLITFRNDILHDYTPIPEAEVSSSSSLSSGYNVRPEHRKIIPLPELTRSLDETLACPDSQVYVPDTVLDPHMAFVGGRRIPRIVHVTAKSRCLAPEFAAVLDQWRLTGHSLFFHDDDAMDALLHRQWAEFPALNALLRCFQYGGAMKADVWRLLVMWE